MVYAVSWQLFRVSGAEDEVTLEAGVDDLYDDVLVGEADDKSVFWRVAGYLSIYCLQVEALRYILLVLGLSYKSFAGIVYGIMLSVSELPDRMGCTDSRSCPPVAVCI